MHTAERNAPVGFQPYATFVLRRLIPLAYGVFLAGYLISMVVVSAGRPPRIEDGIMSGLLSRSDNPRGFFIAAAATAVCGLLLLPTATLFQRGCERLHRRWAVLGAWIYRVGLVATIATGAATPFQEADVPSHIYLAFLAFMSLMAGLAMCHVGVALAMPSARLRHATLATLQGSVLLYLAYLFFTPRYFDGRRWFLAVCEWVVSALIVSGTVSLAALFRGGPLPRGDSGEEKRTFQQDGAANGSPPIRAQTKRTSSAAGARR